MSGVIVGVDGSTYARRALRWAADYAGLHTQPLTAVLAWDYIAQQHLPGEPAFDPEYSEASARDVLSTLVERAVGAGHHVGLHVVLDRAGPALIDAASGADLVVVGARGVGGFRGLLLGSVSQHVLHHAGCPVAVIRDAGADDGPIVVGIDGSEQSRRALAWAADHAAAQPQQPTVIAVYVWSPPYSVSGFYARFPDPHRLQLAAEQFAQHEVAQVDASGLATPIDVRALDGRASARLLEFAAEASLVVVGSRGRGAVKGALLGSVSEQVSHHAPCPVVVIP